MAQRGSQFINPMGRQGVPRQLETAVGVGPSGSALFFEVTDPTVNYVQCDVTSNTIAVTLVDPSFVAKGFTVFVKDISNNAATHNITVTTDGAGATIEASATINTNGGWRVWKSDGASKWYLVGRDTGGASSFPSTANQVVYIDSGGVTAGSSSFAWVDASTSLQINTPVNVGMLAVRSTGAGANILEVEGSGGNQWLTIAETVGGGPACIFGDADGAFSGIGYQISDTLKTAIFGDIGNVSGGLLLTLDLNTNTATFNKPFQFDGDIILTATAGAPADTPATRTMRYDASTNKIWIYNGSAWKSVTLT